MFSRIEPANTWFSRIIYRNFHHEDFDENGGWHLKKNGGRLSNANQAIPYIIFERDLKIFKEKFPGFSLIKKHKFNNQIIKQTKQQILRAESIKHSIPWLNLKTDLLSQMEILKPIFLQVVGLFHSHS